VPVRPHLTLVLIPAIAALAAAQRKEPPSQTLPLLKDPPAAVVADSSRLTFRVSPLSAKGLLTQQTRDALEALLRTNRGATIVKLRAFVAGTADARRVQSIVSEIFTDRKQPLPALSTVQIGALPLDRAQIVIESIAEEKSGGGKKPPNPNGLVFLPTEHADSPSAALSKLEASAKAAQVAASDMLRITCFLGSLDDDESTHPQTAFARTFPAAAAVFVQRLRFSVESSADCEGIGRRATGGSNPPQLIFTGAQMAFGDKDSDVLLAFGRLKKTLNSLGSGDNDVIFSDLYPLSRAIEGKLPPAHGPATTLIVEGLPSPDASLAIEAVAMVRR
jgi:enamine deaminase RidA (YjgF/YER057c/UK114 family)